MSEAETEIFEKEAVAIKRAARVEIPSTARRRSPSRNPFARMMRKLTP